MTASDAWLLESSDTLTIAVSDHEMVEYIDAPLRFEVSGSPEYCSAVVLWHDNLVPIMDVAVLLGNPPDETKNRVSLLTYQEKPGEALQQLAISVVRAPLKIRVDDGQASDLPEQIATSVLMPISLSCFSHDDKPVIVLDISRLASAEFRDIAYDDQNLLARSTGF